MPLSKGKKRLVGILLLIYAGVVIWFIVETATRDKPDYREAIIVQLMEDSRRYAQEHGVEPLSRSAAEAVYKDHYAPKGSIIAVNYTIVIQMLNFIVFLVAVYAFGWRPLVEFLDERRSRIREDIGSARKARDEAEGDRQQAGATLREARQRRMALRERAAREAGQDKQAILEKAHEDAERLLKDARERLEAEIEAARDALRREVGDLAVQVAQKLLERELQQSDHEKLVADAIAQLEES